MSLNDYQDIIKSIEKNARATWPGKTGEERAQRVIAFVKKIVQEYSEAFRADQIDVLRAIESSRDYCVVNYYQEANFPSLVDVMLFDDIEQFKIHYPSGTYRCPACMGQSTDPNTCNSGLIVNNSVCNWKSYGLFRRSDQGLRIAFRNDFLKRPRVHEIFTPIEA